MANDFVITTDGLTRYFGSKPAVYELNLKVPRGCVFGFLGRNGSGKTTTIRMLLGLLRSTRGQAEVLGENSAELSPQTRGRIGYLTESHRLYAWMTVKEYCEFQSAFYSNWNQRVFDATIDHFSLKPESKVRDLSRGERAGLCLALTLGTDPELLILDDPALGLDPVVRRSLLESMIHLTRKADRTIFFSSHLLADVERVADYIAVMDRSILRASCPLNVFQERITQRILRFDGVPPELPEIPGMLSAVRTEHEIRLTTVDTENNGDAILKSLGVRSIEAVPLTLEDAFISYLGDRRVKSFVPEPEDAEV